MKRLLTLSFVAFLALGVQAQYQLQNSGFEDWEVVKKSGNNEYSEPVSWSSFWTMTTSSSLYESARGQQLESSEDAHSGDCSAKIFARKVVIATAQGNLTTGCINGGSMTASDASGNYNYTNEYAEGQAMRFTGRPDAIRVWLKGSTTNTVKVAAYLHAKGYYQDPNTANTDKLAALIAEATATPSISSTWTVYTVNFTYSSENRPYYALVSFATSSIAGKGSTSDYMYIDDVEMIYYSELKSAAYNGTTLNFTNGAATVDAVYDESLLELTSNGVAATIEKSYDETTGLLTVTVKGDNISEDSNNQHIYTIQFALPTPQVVSSKTYSEDLYITVDGETTDKQVANVVVETLDNDNINFVLKNFVLEGLPVGNIAVNDIEVAADGSFSFNNGIQIIEGDDPAYEGSWIGPDLTTMFGGSVPVNMTGQFVDENRVVVYISINLGEQAVEVHLGYARATMAVNAAAKYGTFCAPYAVNVPAGVQAYTVSSVVDRVLTLDEVAQTIPANTPVVLFAESGLASVESFGIAVSGTPTVGLLTGVYENTKAPVGSYVLQDVDETVGFYQVASGKQPTVGANRCYLTVSSNIKAFFFNEDDATGVNDLNVDLNANDIIYNLAGQRINKMQKGVNIINGKKILK